MVSRTFYCQFIVHTSFVQFSADFLLVSVCVLYFDILPYGFFRSTPPCIVLMRVWQCTSQATVISFSGLLVVVKLKYFCKVPKGSILRKCSK